MCGRSRKALCGGLLGQPPHTEERNVGSQSQQDLRRSVQSSLGTEHISSGDSGRRVHISPSSSPTRHVLHFVFFTTVLQGRQHCSHFTVKGPEAQELKSQRKTLTNKCCGFQSVHSNTLAQEILS